MIADSVRIERTTPRLSGASPHERSPRCATTPRLAAGLFVFLGLLLPACAPKIVEPRVDDSDYIFPEFKRGELSSPDEKALRGAWNDVLTGRLARAEQTVTRLLAGRSGPRPVRVVRGFIALRGKRPADAEAIFASVLKAHEDDTAALVGLASAKRMMGLLDDALPFYLKAVRLRPHDAALVRRTGEVKLAVAEAAIGRAASLAAEGRKPEAIGMLRKALEVAPELSPIRLELADLLIEAGRRTEALAVLTAAEEADRNIAMRIASIRFEDGDLDAAERALRAGLVDLAEDPDGAALLARIKERRSFLALPEPLRAIGEASRVTRAELAALVVVRIDALRARKPTAASPVASDLSRTWARSYILRAIELGLMDVYPNHTFQPSGVVRRGELAVVAARVLDLAGWGKGNAAAPRDMSPSHLQYSSAVRVLGAGVMQSTATGAFEPWRIVSGAEVKSVVDALVRFSAQR